MITLLEKLSERMSAAFLHYGYSVVYGRVTLSDRKDLCQFQCNGAFLAAKAYRKAPREIALEVICFLQDDPVFKKIELAGIGFINMDIRDEVLLDYVKQVIQDKHSGIPQAEKSETIFLDYGGANVAKPLHIGHLRSAVLGECLKRLVKATGRIALADVHLGDWGLQMGLVIAELEERNPAWSCFKEEFDPVYDSIPALCRESLNAIYPYASQKSENNIAFKRKAQTVTAKLQKGHSGYTALWRGILRVSAAELKGVYTKLNVTFDLWQGESDTEKEIPELQEILNRKGLLQESEGALVVEVSEETDLMKVPPVIIKKSDQSAIYATTDLAAILQRQREFKPQKIWYIVDHRQSLHFLQIFRCARKAGLIPAETGLEHLGFGTMNGTDKKPYKTRDGGVMQLSHLYQIVYEAAYQKIKYSEFSQTAEKEEIARKLAIAAIKFGDLINHRLKDYVFDLERFLAEEGKTGIFLLYTVARIHSVLNTVGYPAEREFDSQTVYSEIERQILLTIALSGDMFEQTFCERAPNYICENAYQLASLFSKFYHDCRIIKEQDPVKKKAWIHICIAVKRCLETHLNILGIEPVNYI